MLDIKRQLHQLCVQNIASKIAIAKTAIAQAQESANQESKSSMGDKYETGRAMAQLEIEKNTAQLAEASRVKQLLDQIKVERTSPVIQLGSVVITNSCNFYISISLGVLKIASTEYFAVSPISPIGKQLLALKKGDELLFNKDKIKIKDVF